jgi:hypothetical protein
VLKTHVREKRQLIQQVMLESWISTCRNSHCTVINSEYFKDLKVRLGTFKLLEENTEETVQGRGTDNNFLNRTPTAQEIMIFIIIIIIIIK